MAIGLSYQTGQLEIGSYYGAPIRVSPLFFLLAAGLALPFWRMISLTGVVLALIFMAVVFASVLLHELAHAETARRFGVATERIDIHVSGGLVRLIGWPRTPQQDFAITLAGPLANLAIALFAIALAAMVPIQERGMIMIGDQLVPDPFTHVSMGVRAFRAAAYLNLALFAVNLLPAVPLDGGRLLYLVVAQRWNTRIALKTVGALGMVFAFLSGLATVIGALAGLGIWAPPSFQPNLQAFEAADQGSADWDSQAFPTA
jgi:Zn-dependent protease